MRCRQGKPLPASTRRLGRYERGVSATMFGPRFRCPLDRSTAAIFLASNRAVGGLPDHISFTSASPFLFLGQDSWN